MNFLDVANIIIPGYNSLTRASRLQFEISDAGQKFIALIDKILLSIKKTHSSFQWWSVFSENQEPQKKLYIEDSFLLEMANDSDYQELLTQLTLNALEKECSEFDYLSPSQKKLLASQSFSQKLMKELVSLNHKPHKNHHLFGLEKNNPKTIQNTKKSALAEWRRTFFTENNLISLHETVALNKKIMKKEKITAELATLTNHANRLAQIFPLLNFRTSEQESAFNQLLNTYQYSNGKVTANPGKYDQEKLTNLIFKYVEQESLTQLHYINLTVFNQQFAKEMAESIRLASKNKTSFNIDDCLNDYQKTLYQHLKNDLLLFNGKQWQTYSNKTTRQLSASLSFLWHNKAVDTMNRFMSKLADAHAFIQATSFSTQNENSILALIDIYNYGQYFEKISEIKNMITGLLQSFTPLYDEYKNIAFYEQNAAWKALRILLPIVINLSFIIGISTILAPFALPELAFAAVFIPTLLTGAALANEYVRYKNDAYKWLRNTYYGGSFEIPEFQVNQRMMCAFGDELQASRVRELYIEEIKKCDQEEIIYSVKHRDGLLTTKDITLRQETKVRRHQLCLEWYDIHSNKDLSYEETPFIAKNRFQETSDREYFSFEKMSELELKSIQQSIVEMTAQLKETFSRPNPVNASIKNPHNIGLFKTPQCFVQKKHMVKIAELGTSLMN